MKRKATQISTEDILSILEMKYPHKRHSRMECRLLWTLNGVSRYRVNWYDIDWFHDEERMVDSAFLRVTDEFKKIIHVQGEVSQEI